MSHVYLKLSVRRRKQTSLETLRRKASSATTLLNQTPPCTDTSHMLCQVYKAHSQPLPHDVPPTPHSMAWGILLIYFFFRQLCSPEQTPQQQGCRAAGLASISFGSSECSKFRDKQLLVRMGTKGQN